MPSCLLPTARLDLGVGILEGRNNAVSVQATEALVREAPVLVPGGGLLPQVSKLADSGYYAFFVLV